MLKQPELFPSVNQIPPKGLKAKKEQALDPLEGLRCKVHTDKFLIKAVDPYGLGVWHRCPMRDYSVLEEAEVDSCTTQV